MVQLAEATLADFVANSNDHLSSLRESGSAELLTVEGQPALVVQDAEAYRELLQLAEQGLDDLRLQAALQDFRNSERGECANTVFDRIRGRYEVANG